MPKFARVCVCVSLLSRSPTKSLPPVELSWSIGLKLFTSLERKDQKSLKMFSASGPGVEHFASDSTFALVLLIGYLYVMDCSVHIPEPQIQSSQPPL